MQYPQPSPSRIWAAKPKIWLVVLILLLAGLACNFGQPPEVVPTPAPPTNTAPPPDVPTNTPEAVPPTDAPPAEPTPQTPIQPTGSLTGQQRQRLAKATVLIYGAQEVSGQLQYLYIGSGTIISADGLILTNAHVASPASQGNFDYEPDALIVAILEDESKPPRETYFADLLAVDGFLDLAVIKIATTLDGSPVNPADLHFDFVELGNSDDMHLGDTINIFGFPGIGGATITFTKGSVSGFTSEDPIGDRAWIKTDATIAGGNSGGLGANDLGQIIGIPTIASSGASGDVTDCRVIQDTNGDGYLDNSDTCIPIGGFINALRPVNLALPLIRAAQSGTAYVSPYDGGVVSEPGTPGSGTEQLNFVAWTEEFGDDSCPTNPVTSFPTGVKQVSAIYSYSGMTDGQAMAMYWMIDGEVVVENQFTWDGGSDAACYAFYVHNGGEALPDGTYTLELYNDSSMLSQQTVTVGGTGQTTPTDTSDFIFVDGYVIDAETGKGIAGAVVIVLWPGTDMEAWLDNGTDADIYAYAETDESGYFNLILPFFRDQVYPGIAGMDGYEPSEGDISFTADDGDTVTLEIQLTK
ncbi:MAG TPA: trypsin-like peptidase domain-containing protein [Anaerolineales bacterium]|nr:trypsin-like peptidase domain-containing protein [Anaerolineales bacterium]